MIRRLLARIHCELFSHDNRTAVEDGREVTRCRKCGYWTVR